METTGKFLTVLAFMNISGGFLTAISFKEYAETPLEYQRYEPSRFWETEQYNWFLPAIADLITVIKSTGPAPV